MKRTPPMREGSFTENQVLSLARAAYERGDAGFEIVPEQCALLVIDMQDEFVRPHWTPDWVPEATRQVPRIKSLIEYCRRAQIPVIFTVARTPQQQPQQLQMYQFPFSTLFVKCTRPASSAFLSTS